MKWTAALLEATRTCRWTTLGLVELRGNMLCFCKDMFPPIPPHFETSKRFSLSETWRTNLTSLESFKRFSLSETWRTNLTHGVDPTTPNTRRATALAQAIFPQVRGGGRKIFGPAKLEPKWHDHFDQYHFVSSLTVADEAVDRECMPRSYPPSLPPHHNPP